MDVFGQTRSRLSNDYALLTPDTHVSSPLVGWENTTAVIHISPEMSARFTQYTATMEAGGSSAMPGENVQRFLYVQEGSCSLSLGEAGPEKLKQGAYAFIPAQTEHEISCDKSAKLVVFEKEYQPFENHELPQSVIGHSNDLAGETFMGDEDLKLKTLLPVAPEFDMAVNIFTYQPGATLPQVEIHVMEHGLLMLAGQGVYRLSNDYFPVTAGDVIWMSSYCPQWFVAMGKSPASYIYYKDVNRDRLHEKLL